MEPGDADVDWVRWFERWQRMQDCYVPQRRYRFDLIFQLPHLPPNEEVHILNLGCGPGSLAFHAFRFHPKARVVAVDLHPVLLRMGMRVAEKTGKQVEFVRADLRESEWWRAYRGRFDLVVSATALHWLSSASLHDTYRHAYEALKAGGWLMNSDHVASDSPRIQQRYRRMRAAKRQAAFSAASADDWDGFWTELGRELGRPELLESANAAEYWEGSDDGQPRELHLADLRAIGFDPVCVHWQDLGEAIIGAQKPASSTDRSPP